jgi:hypothetical protein
MTQSVCLSWCLYLEAGAPRGEGADDGLLPRRRSVVGRRGPVGGGRVVLARLVAPVAVRTQLQEGLHLVPRPRPQPTHKGIPAVKGCTMWLAPTLVATMMEPTRETTRVTHLQV